MPTRTSWLRSGLLAWALAPGAALAQERDCSISPVRPCLDCQSSVVMTIAPGAACRLDFRIPNAMKFLGQTVLRRPTKGVYGTANAYQGAYKANPGASGTDSFEVEIAYDIYNGQAKTRYHVDVRFR